MLFIIPDHINLIRKYLSSYILWILNGLLISCLLSDYLK